MAPYPFTNFELEKYYQNEPRFNSVYWRINLPKDIYIKDGTYVINVGTHWSALFEFPEEIKEFVGNKNIIANIFRAQANHSVICSNFCTGFIDFMLAGKKLTNFTSMFSPYDFKENDDIILSYFKNKWM